MMDMQVTSTATASVDIELHGHVSLRSLGGSSFQNIRLYMYSTASTEDEAEERLRDALQKIVDAAAEVGIHAQP